MKSQTRATPFIALVIAAAISASPILAGHCEIAPAGTCNTCYIDLDAAVTNCPADMLSSISFGPGSSQAVMQIAPLDGTAFPVPWTRAIFEIFYNAVPVAGEWTVNIGDSRSNNGFGGDGTHQSRDSELQIVAEDLSVWSDDHLNAGASCPTCSPAPATKKALELCHFVGAPSTSVKLEITDNQLRWNGEPSTCEKDGTLRSQFIYSLGGQPDFEGPVNSDIFAAFNRTIQFHSNRTGKSVSYVELTLCDQ